MKQEEGYIKYYLEFEETRLEKNFVSDELVAFRNTLAEQKLIGVYPDGIGYGNISERTDAEDHFSISGTQTGRIQVATAKDFCLVTDFDISKNSLRCRGLVKASSEALTHAAFYKADKNINAVIHVHHFQLWEKLLQMVPTTDASVAYGTPAMAEAVIKLLQTKAARAKRIIVTAGHAEGIFTFGETMQEAYDVLMLYVQSNYY